MSHPVFGVLHGKSGGKALMAALKRLERTEVLVGYPAGEPPREDGSPLNNATIAYIQNYGAPEANIPAREFMGPGIRAVRDRVAAQLKKAARAVLADDEAGMQAGWIGAGEIATASIKETITNVIPPPLAPKTLRARKASGFNGDTPLLRSGELRSGVKYVIVGPRNSPP